MTTNRTMVLALSVAATTSGASGVVPLSRLRPQSEEGDPEFSPRLPRPSYPLTFNKAVRIGPDRPAPVRYDAGGRIFQFQEDLDALADHGSYARLPLPAGPR